MTDTTTYRPRKPLPRRRSRQWLGPIVALLLAMFVSSPAPADVWFLGIGNDGYYSDVIGLRNAYQQVTNPNGTPIHFRTYSNHGGTTMLRDINWLADNAQPGDLAFFYYSGHGGYTSEDNGDELAGWALDSFDETIGRAADWCTDDELANAFASIDSAATLVTMFDACWAGGMVGGTEDLNSLTNVYVMMSSRENQVSYGGSPYSRFTNELIRGISDSLPADVSPRDGIVTLGEWFDYARDNVHGQDPISFDAGSFGSLPIVPEPTTLVLLATGAAAILCWRRKHNLAYGRKRDDRIPCENKKMAHQPLPQSKGDRIMRASTKTLVLSLALLTTIRMGDAQATEIGPDAYGYLATDNVPYTWEEISTTGTRTLYGSDDGTASRNLLFTFNFYGTDYNSVSWSPNGLMTLGGSTGQYINENLITSDGPANLPCIGALWDDWDSDDYGSGVYYATRGVPGSRRFILQWHDLDGYNSSPSNVTFQAILFEGSNDILLQYQDVYSGNYRNYGASATVGIRDRDGHLNGENLQWSYNAGVISGGQAILYQVPEPATLSLLIAVGGCAVFYRWLRKRRRE